LGGRVINPLTSLYILASFYKWNLKGYINGIGINRDYQSSIAAGLKYLYLGALSSSLFLLGSAIIYGYTGLTNLSDIALLGINISNISENSIYYIIPGFILIGIALLFKIGAVPFHNWAPKKNKRNILHLGLNYQTPETP